MIRSHGLKLGLCALVVGLMAFVTGGVAQAEPGASWNYIKEGKLQKFGETAGSLLPQAQIKEVENKTATLFFKTKEGTKVTFLCTEASLFEGGLLTGNGTVSLGRVVFHKCVTFLNESKTPSEACEPIALEKEKGLIRSTKAKGLIVLHKLASGTVDPLVRFLPDVGTVLANVELNEECSVGANVPVEGVLFLEDPAFTTHSANHLIRPGPLTVLTALGQPATLEGSALVKLVAGGHEGLEWAGLPA